MMQKDQQMRVQCRGLQLSGDAVYVFPCTDAVHRSVSIAVFDRSAKHTYTCISSSIERAALLTYDR